MHHVQKFLLRQAYQLAGNIFAVLSLLRKIKQYIINYTKQDIQLIHFLSLKKKLFIK